MMAITKWAECRRNQLKNFVTKYICAPFLPKMDFSRFPDIVLVKIVEYLPLEDCIRVGRVNKSIQRISQLVISRTKSLNLIKDFRNLSADQLAVILDLCSPNLEQIYFPSHDQAGVQFGNWSTTFANFIKCHRLIDIDLGNAPINFAVFDQLIRNNPNIESLVWQANFVGFPEVASKNLKKLNLRYVNDVTLQSMIGRCPNLKELNLITKNLTGNVLDEFLASSQQIQRVSLHLVKNQIVLEEDLVNFWNLPLISLSIFFSGGFFAQDDTLYKVATSFPHIQRLEIFVDHPSSDAIAALVDLQELEVLELNLSSPIDENEDGIQQLVACKHLRELKLLLSIISPGTLLALLRSCPKLESVVICKIDQVETPEEAAVVLGSLSGIVKRTVTIAFHPLNDAMEDCLLLIWKSEAVKEAIRNLERNEGLNVKIDWFERW